MAALAVVTGLANGCATRESATTTSASCVDVVFVEGEQWTSWHLSQPLDRPTSGPAVRAQRITCDDVLEPGETASAAPDPHRHVELLRIDGIRSDQALVDPAEPEYVYVHAGPEIQDIDALPQRVQDLLVTG